MPRACTAQLRFPNGRFVALLAMYRIGTVLLGSLIPFLAACSSDEPAAPAASGCGPTTPKNAPQERIEGAHASDDPTQVRLCVEGEKLPTELSNPWDLHCDIASGLGASVDAAAAPPTRLRILEWNIKFGTDLPGVIDVLENHPEAKLADVLLLVEVDRGCDRSGQVDEARSLAERWGMDWAFGVEFVEHSQGGCEEGNAVLSRYPLLNPVHAFHNVGALERGGLRAPYDWALDKDEIRTGRRSFIGADIRFGSSLLHVVSAHLENRSQAQERADQLGEIVALIDGLPRRAACIAGDFNVFPDLGVPVPDAPLFELMDKTCFENPHGDMPQSERRTRPNLNYQIDFTYTRGVRIADRGVINELTNVPSDHFPVWVDIEAK